MVVRTSAPTIEPARRYSRGGPIRDSIWSLMAYHAFLVVFTISRQMPPCMHAACQSDFQLLPYHSFVVFTPLRNIIAGQSTVAKKDYRIIMVYRCWLTAGYMIVAVVPASAFVLPSPLASSASLLPHLATISTTRLPPKSTTSLTVYDHVAGIDSQLLFDTWEWNANLASPAALVAGAVLATLIDGREAMRAKVTDKKWVINLKKTCRLLLLSSFGLEVLSIFVTVVMGTLLLSLGDIPRAIVDTTANSPMV